MSLRTPCGELHLPLPHLCFKLIISIRNVPRLAKNPPLPTSGSTPPNPRFTLLRSFAFSRSFWSGYEHKMTKGERAHGTGRTGEGGEDRTWEFCQQDVEPDEKLEESWFTRSEF
jgi:hypothetical protein